MHNYMLIFGCAPDKELVLGTNMIRDVMRCFVQGYNKLTQEVIFPENLHLLRGCESRIELVTVPTLRNLRIDITNFRVA